MSASSIQASFSPEMLDTISTIRALIQSRKEMTTEQNLMRDYRELNGENIQFRKFGFKSLESFLLQSDEFTLRKSYSGELLISAVPSQESYHIVSMIQKQKSSKPKKKLMMSKQRAPRSSDQNWQKTSYSRAYSEMPQSRNYEHRRAVQTLINKTNTKNFNNNTSIQRNANISNNNYTTNHNNNYVKPEMPNISIPIDENVQAIGIIQDARFSGKNVPRSVTVAQPQVQMKAASPMQKSPKQAASPAISPPKKPAPVQKLISPPKKTEPEKKPISPPKKTEPVQKPISPPKKTEPLQKPISPPKKPEQQAVFASSPVESLKSNSSGGRGIQNRLNVRIEPTTSTSTPPTSPIVPLMELVIPVPSPPAVFKNSISLQERLKFNQTVSLHQRISMTSLPTTTKAPPLVRSQSQPGPKDSSKQTQNMTSIEELDLYCKEMDYTSPEYKTFIMKPSKRYQCKVLVNDAAHSTYPDEYISEYEAKSAVARIVLDGIKRQEMSTMYPVCMDSDFEITLKMLSKLKESPNGIFSKNFPLIFQNEYKQTLRDGWFDIITGAPALFTIEVISNNVIIYANERSLSSSAASTSSEPDSSICDKQELPWTDEYWYFYITNPVSTTEVWARIIGPEFSEKMDSLLNDIDMAMLTDKKKVTTIQASQIYLVSVSECWHRVRVDQLDYDKNRCLCFYIDTGDEDWYPMDELYMCESRFLKVPAQGVVLSLFGLEDFDENPNAKSQLEKWLAGKTVVGKIFSKREEYELQELSVNFETRIKVVLYDTSTNDDINLNPLILQEICENTPPPQLLPKVANYVNITHISEDGDIYCQLKDSGVHYIEKLIRNLIESKLNEDLHCGLYDDKQKANKYYLYFDEQDKKWYRVIILSAGCEENQYNLFYIDYGMTRLVYTKRLLRSDSLSAALHHFPPQAVKFNLSDVRCSPDVVARMRGMLKPNVVAIVKTINSKHNFAKVFLRQDNGFLVCVNEHILFELEIERISDTDLSSSYSFRIDPIALSGQSSPSSSSCNSGYLVKLPSSSDSLNSSMSEIAAKFKAIDIKHQSSPQKSILPKIPSPVMPAVGDLFNIKVVMASNPQYFVVQSHNDYPMLHELMSGLQNYCDNNSEYVPSSLIVADESYAALHSKGNWHRATVENVLHGTTMVHLHYCDFGDVEVVNRENLKVLPEEFRKLPKQAIKAKLHGIKPKHGDWTTEDCIQFQKMTSNRTFASVVKDIHADELCSKGEQIIEMLLVDVSGETDVTIQDILIEENRAIA